MRVRILKRFARAVVAGALAAAITNLPALSDVLPAPEYAIPVLTALLLAADKWLRERNSEPV